METLIKDGYVHQLKDGRSSFEKKNILIKDDKISYIGDSGDFSNHKIDKIISANNCLVIPGLVNSHLHSHCHFNKGGFDNLPLEVWMLYLRPLYTGISLTPDEIYLRTLFGCIEMLKTGTTTIIDDIVQTPSLNEKNLEMIFKAYRKAGIRSLVTTHLVNMPMYKTIAYCFCQQKLSKSYRTCMSMNSRV